MAGLLREDSNRIFNAIAGRYDVLNFVLSFGAHEAWRRQLARALPQRTERVLDIAVGTASVPLALCRECPQVREVVGVDIAEEMLRQAAVKIARAGLQGKVRLMTADAEALPFEPGSFDAVTTAFSLRNMSHIVNVFAQAFKVLKPDGVFLALEFSRPRSLLAGGLHRLYLGRLLPWLGGALTGNHSAYRHLGKSVLSFPDTGRLINMFRQAGFKTVSVKTMALGAVTLYSASR